MQVAPVIPCVHMLEGLHLGGTLGAYLAPSCPPKGLPHIFDEEDLDGKPPAQHMRGTA